MTTASYMSISVQIDTPDAPALDGRPVRTVSWTAIRQDSGRVSYSIYAHHHDGAKGKESLTAVLYADALDRVTVPAWVPWPPAGWLASLELERDLIAEASAAIDAEMYPDPAASLRAYMASEGR